MSAGHFRTRFWRVGLAGAVFAAALSIAHANPSRAPHRVEARPVAYGAALASPAESAHLFDAKYRLAARPAMQYVGVQYAGAITQVSAETRGVPHPPSNGQSMHTGSIRDDVARYNEERVSRQITRPPVDSGRQQGSSQYRN